MNKSIAYLLMPLMLLQSCVVYQNTPATLTNAVDSEKQVKLTNSMGSDFYFKKVIIIDSTYYGVSNHDTVRIVQGQDELIYLKDIKKSKNNSKIVLIAVSMPLILLIFVGVFYASGAGLP